MSGLFSYEASKKPIVQGRAQSKLSSAGDLRSLLKNGRGANKKTFVSRTASTEKLDVKGLYGKSGKVVNWETFSKKSQNTRKARPQQSDRKIGLSRQNKGDAEVKFTVSLYGQFKGSRKSKDTSGGRAIKMQRQRVRRRKEPYSVRGRRTRQVQEAVQETEDDGDDEAFTPYEPPSSLYGKGGKVKSWDDFAGKQDRGQDFFKESWADERQGQ